MTARRTNLVEPPTYEDVARLLLKKDAPLWLNAHLEWWAQGMVADRLKEESQPTKVQMRKRLFALQAASKLIERELGSTSMREVLAVDPRGPLKDVSKLPLILQRLTDHVEFVRTSPSLARKDGTTKRGRNKAMGPYHFSAKTRCAARIIELWLHFFGREPGAQSEKAAKAAQMYWLASGGGMTALSSWRDEFNRVKAHKNKPELRNQRQLWRIDLLQNARNERTPWYLGRYSPQGKPLFIPAYADL
jgi:hypothetical protein